VKRYIPLSTNKGKNLIAPLNKYDKRNYLWLMEIVEKYSNPDFYFTENNARMYVVDEYTLKKFLFSSKDTYTANDERGDYAGMIMLWQSVGGGKSRYYVKMVAQSAKFATDLLTVLLWNTKETLFVKIRKDSEFLPVFKQKGFRFQGGRGCQILLKRKPTKDESKEKEHGSHSNEYRDNSKKSTR